MFFYPFCLATVLYYYRAWSFDGTNYSSGLGDSATTFACSGEPSVQASNVFLTDKTETSINLTWTAGTGGDSYIVVFRESNTINFTPTDGIDYSADTASGDFSSATDQNNGNKVVYSGIGTTATITNLNPSSVYFFQVFHFCSTSFNYIIADGTFNDGNVSEVTFDPPMIIAQDFDNTLPGWPYDNDVPFFNNTWGSDGYYGVIDISQTSQFSNTNFNNNILGENDLNDEDDNGTPDFATITFDEVWVELFSNKSLRFDWELVGYNASGDDAKFEVFFDGVGQGEVLLTEGGIDPADASGSVSVMIPNGINLVSLKVAVRNNGASGYSAFDNFQVKGNYEGDYIFSGGSLQGVAPNNSDSFSNALVQDGTYTTSGDISLYSLTILNGANVNVSSDDVLSITQEINNMGTLTFKSDANGTAQLGNANNVIILDDVTVERYIPAKRAFRLLSSPVTTADFIYENWQQSGLNPGDTGYEAHAGTQITGGTSGDGFDQSGTNNPSLYTFDNTDSNATGVQTDDWIAIPNSNATKLNAGEPYLTFVRGDRSIDLTSNSAPATATTLRASGELYVGSLTYDIGNATNYLNLSNVDEFYNLVANPYQAVVDYNGVTRTGLTDFIYVWDASISGANGRGAYVTVNYLLEIMS